MSLVIWIVLYLAALGVGHFVCNFVTRGALRESFHVVQALLLEILIGTGTMGTIAMLGNWAGVLPRPIAIAIPILLAPYGAIVLWREWPLLRAAIGRLCNLRDIVGLIPLLVVFALYAKIAWYPRITGDAWDYHFTVPKQWVIQGHLVEVPYQAAANYYLLAQSWMFWGIAFSKKDFILPHLHTMFGLAGMTLFLLMELRRRVGPAMAWYFALFWPITDEMYEWGASDYIDPAQGFFVLAGCIVAARAMAMRGETRRGLLIAAGLILGFATGMKIMGVVVFAAAVAVIAALLVLEKNDGEAKPFWPRLRPVLHLIASFSVAIMPWIAKSAVYTGDPVYPLAVDLFPTLPQHVQSAHELQVVYAEFFTEKTPWQSIEFRFHQAIEYIRQAYYLDQHLIVMAYAAAFCVFLLRKNKTPEAWAAFGIGALLIPFTIFSPQRRFAMGPAAFQFFLLAVVVGTMWCEAWRERRKMKIAAIGICLAAMLINKIDDDIDFFYYHGFSKQVFSRHLFLTPASMRDNVYAKEPFYPMLEFIESTAKPGDIVLTAGNGMIVPLLDVPVFENAHVNGKDLMATLAEVEGNDAPTIAKRLHAWGITNILTVWPISQEGEVGRFAREYLEPVKVVAGMTYYRLKSN